MRAVDSQTFAGGMLLGVSQAGFEIVGKRELPGGFGVPSVQANLAHLNRSSDFEIQVSPSEEWSPVDVQLVFGNPPCSAFSGVSDKFFAGMDNKVNECMYALVDYGARCRAPVIAYESVQNAYTKGLPLLRTLHARLEERTGAEYNLFHVLHNAVSAGGCAVRRRYFWVAAVRGLVLDFAYDSANAVTRAPTLYEAIGDLQGLLTSEDALKEQPYTYGPALTPDGAEGWSTRLRRADGLVDGHAALRPQYHRQSQALLDEDGAWREGESMTSALSRYVLGRGHWPRMENERDAEFARHYGPDEGGRNFNFGGAWQPERWRFDRPARVVTGGSSARSLHPREPRPLTLREMFRIQGFPDSWLLEPAVRAARGSLSTAALWPGKGIPVQCGRWLGGCVKSALEGAPVSDGRLRQTGEREFVWDGTAGPRTAEVKRSVISRRRAPRAVPAQARNGETQMTLDLAADAARIRSELETVGVSSVSFAGLEDPKEVKKVKELLYAAAYGMGRKVAVKTDKVTQTATGTLLDGAHVPGERKRVAAPPAPAPAGAERRPEYFPGGRVKDPHLGDLSECRRYVYTGEGTGPFNTGYSLVSATEPVQGMLVFDEPCSDQLTLDDLLDSLDVPAFEPVDPNALAVTESGSDDSDERQYDTQKKTSARRKARDDRRYDLTQLRETSHGYYAHRDYAAHMFRWGWAARWVKGETKLLDVGSGQDLALARVLIYHNGLPDPKQGGEMVAVDLNRLKEHVNPAWLTVYDEFDFNLDWKKVYEQHGLFDLVSCFEVIEHMGPDDGDRLLAAIRTVLAPEGKVLLSTPVFGGKAAVNHVHEYGLDELRAAFGRAGLQVLDRYGTFGSYYDVKRGVNEFFDAHGEHGPEAARLCLAFYESLRRYYADDVLACFMAPNLPDHARNCVWVLGHAVS